MLTIYQIILENTLSQRQPSPSREREYGYEIRLGLEQQQQLEKEHRLGPPSKSSETSISLLRQLLLCLPLTIILYHLL